MFDDPSNPSPPATVLEMMDGVFWIAVLERMLAQARDFEKRVAEHVKAAEAPKSTLLKAKLNRLDVEVALERAKDK